MVQGAGVHGPPSPHMLEHMPHPLRLFRRSPPSSTPCTSAATASSSRCGQQTGCQSKWFWPAPSLTGRAAPRPSVPWWQPAKGRGVEPLGGATGQVSTCYCCSGGRTCGAQPAAASARLSAGDLPGGQTPAAVCGAQAPAGAALRCAGHQGARPGPGRGTVLVHMYVHMLGLWLCAECSCASGASAVGRERGCGAEGLSGGALERCSAFREAWAVPQPTPSAHHSPVAPHSLLPAFLPAGEDGA